MVVGKARRRQPAKCIWNCAGSSNVNAGRRCVQVATSVHADIPALSRSVVAVNDVICQQRCPQRCSALRANVITLEMYSDRIMCGHPA
jgi:hypothetical protein